MKKLLLTLMAGAFCTISAFSQAPVIYITGSTTTPEWNAANPETIKYNQSTGTYDLYNFPADKAPVFKLSTETANDDWKTFNANGLGISKTLTVGEKMLLEKNSNDIATPSENSYTLQLSYENGNYYMLVSTVSGEIPEIVIPKKVYIRGTINDWSGKEEQSLALQSETPQDGFYVYTGTFASLSGEFKLSGEPNSWVAPINFGAGSITNPTVGQRIECVFNGQNFKCSTSLTNVTLTFYFNPDGVSYLYTSTDAPITYPDNLYIVGQVNELDWNPTEGVMTSGKDGVYTFSDISVANKNEGYGSFAFTLKLGADGNDWGTLNANRYAPTTQDELIAVGETKTIEFGVDRSWKILAGTYNFTVNLKEMNVSVTGGEDVVPPTPDVVEELYVVGDLNGWAIKDSEIKLNKIEDNVFSGSFEVPKGKFEFCFFSKLGSWEANHFGAPTSEDNLTITLTDGVYTGEVVDSKANWKVSGWNGGTVTATVDLDAMTVEFVCQEDEYYPEALYLSGPFNGWNKKEDKDFTLNPVEGKNGVYSATFTLPQTVEYNNETVNALDFKVIEVVESEENPIWYGLSGDNIFLYKDKNSSYQMTTADGANNFNCGNWKGGKFTITVDLTKMELTIVAPDQPEVPTPANITQLYLVGNFNGWTLADPKYVITKDENTGLFTATFEMPATIGEGNDAEVPTFKLAVNEDWAYAYGYEGETAAEAIIYSNVTAKVNLKMGYGTSNISIANWEGGELTLTFDLSNNQLELAGDAQPKLQPTELWLVGPFTGWELDKVEDYIIKQTGVNNGIYEAIITLPETTTYEEKEVNAADFKIAYGSSWGETFGQAGGAFPLYSNYDVTTPLVVDGGNWTVSNWAGGELKVTVNLNDGGSITISGSDQPEFVAPGEELYLVGAPQGWDVESDEIVLLYNEDTKLYSAVVEIEDDEFNFILYTDLGDWESNYIGAPATSSDNFEVVLSNNEYTGPISYASKTNWLISDWTAAAVTITVDVEKMTISFTDITPVEDDGSTAVDSLVEEGVVSGIYNLQGVRVDRNKLTKGIYIIDGKKVMVK